MNPVPTIALCYPSMMNPKQTTSQREPTTAQCYTRTMNPRQMNHYDHGRFNQIKTNDLTCKYCLKSGHSKETCWQLNPSRRPARYGGQRRCMQCGRTHYMGCCTVTTDNELASLYREIEREAIAQNRELTNLYRRVQRTVEAQQKGLLLTEEQKV